MQFIAYRFGFDLLRPFCFRLARVNLFSVLFFSCMYEDHDPLLVSVSSRIFFFSVRVCICL
jgi:hypothetical protein